MTLGSPLYMIRYGKIFILSWYLLILPADIVAQHHDTTTLVKGQVSGEEAEILSKKRQLIISALAENNLATIQQAFFQVESRFTNTNILPFWLGERVLLHLLTRQYTFPLSVGTIDSILNTVSNYRPPPDDGMYGYLVAYATTHKSEVIRNIHQGDLSKDEQAYLRILFPYVIFQQNSTIVGQDSINTLSETFLREYPNSRFAPFIRTEIRETFRPSPWGFGFDFFTGLGQFRGDLSMYFTGHVPVGIGFEIYFNRVGVFLRDYIGFGGSVESGFEYQGIWPFDLPVNVLLPEVDVGYVISNSDELKITPFLGVSSMNIAPPLAQRNDGFDVGLDFVKTYTYGVNFDLKLKASEIPIVHSREQSTWIVKCRVAMNHPTYTTRDARFDGSLISFTVGFGAFGRKLLREY